MPEVPAGHPDTHIEGMAAPLNISVLPSATSLLPYAAGCGLVIAAAAWRTRLRGPALWLALLIISQAASLQLVEAGPTVRFQHYANPLGLSPDRYWLPIGVLVLQWIAVFLGVRNHFGRIRDWLTREFHPWQLAGILTFFVFSSAVLSRSIAAYGAELLFASLAQLVSLANTFLIVAATRPDTGRSFHAALRRFEGPRALDRGPGVDGFALAAALWVAVLAAALSIVAYQRHPHVPDEVIYLFQARYFADGTLSVPAPPVPEAFDVDITVNDSGVWYSPAPPGWPAVLALGTKAGAPWLVNPLLAGLCVLLAFSLVADLYDRRTARWTVLLLACSPWLVFMGMNFMTHTASLAAALVAVGAAVRAIRVNRLAWLLLAGTALGVVGLIRPLEAVAVAGVLSLALVASSRGWFRTVVGLSVLGLAAAGTASPMLWYNKALTGSATTFALTSYVPEGVSPSANALGFGPDRGFGWTGLDPFPGHDVLDAVINGALNTALVNTELFGWSIGSLLLLLLFLFAGRPRRQDYLMWAWIAAVLFVHTFYWFAGGPDFGARYWYLAVLPAAVLSVRGVETLEQRLVNGDATAQRRRLPGVYLAISALCAASLVTFFPWRAVDKYRHYRGMRPDILRLAESHDFGRSLVLIRGDRHPDYASAFTYNPLDLHADGPIYAWDKDPAVRQQVVSAYPDRPVWRVDGPCITLDGYEVRAGPLPPGSWE